MLTDFHSHSTLSDRQLSIEEMVAAAECRGYDVFAITDHGRADDFRDIVIAVRAEIDRLASQTMLRLFAGVELTEIEPHALARVADEARAVGAQIVVVHGECPMTPAPSGTNAAAVRSHA